MDEVIRGAVNNIVRSELGQRPASVQSLLEIGLRLTFVSRPHRAKTLLIFLFIGHQMSASMFRKLIKLTKLNRVLLCFTEELRTANSQKTQWQN